MAKYRKKTDAHGKLAEKLNRARVDFIKLDLDAALTFTSVAKTTRDAVTRDRNIANARKGYDTVRRYLAKSDLSPEEVEEISDKVTLLEAALADLEEAAAKRESNEPEKTTPAKTVRPNSRGDSLRTTAFRLGLGPNFLADLLRL